MIDFRSLIDANFTPIEQDKDPEKWVQLRTTGIGGSDAGAIMGLNKYVSPLTIYMAKKGFDGFSGNASTQWGHILEDPIRQKAKDELGIEIETIPGMFTSKEYPFMNANLDGLCHADHQVTIRGETIEGYGGHEIKTSASGDGFTEDEIPDSYYCQVQHYMAVTGLSWFILTVFILSTKQGKHYVIKKNNEFIYSKLIPAEKNFWENYVMKDEYPEPTGVDSESEYIKSLPMDEVINLDETTEEVIKTEREIDSQIKELTKKQAALKNEILIRLSELSVGFDKADKTSAIGSKYKLTYTTQGRKSVDSNALKSDGLYDRYCKETFSKIMRISEVK